MQWVQAKLARWYRASAEAAFKLLVVLLAEAEEAYKRLAKSEQTVAWSATRDNAMVNVASLTYNQASSSIACVQAAARTNMLQAVECIGEAPSNPQALPVTVFKTVCATNPAA